ncbi:PepSY domain-containing protein [Aquimarina sp. U1-2]|uniref:PepSY-associated TM helix domain-containing protein n=1 Tax=Aquimarina sp. U1-2 TaxID=2823141 RepID=UPI001AECB8FF|nr:PepSY domain-containing protein [Aquimarina sp. U1-2]MBP2833404.1 PepSY domain-containing protein [Aquimarina sp. U1-2]
MKKNKNLNKWLWKWHFIAGLISLPFVLIISITGGIYLFKTNYETPRQKHIKKVAVEGTPISFQEQWQIARNNTSEKLNAIVLSANADQATQFVSGRFGRKSSVYVNPYTGKVSGTIATKDTDMFKVRKLHGELLMGKFGTKIIELIASWMVVLIITGLYVWWPARQQMLKGVFVPRLRQGKRIIYRDIHAISGFWMSGLLLLILAGGFPWTDVFGDNFKRVQKVTNTGYPSTWEGREFRSEIKVQPLTIDQMINKAKALQLPGIVTVHLPNGPSSVFSASNYNPSNLESQKKVHFDQYSGHIIMTNHWSDVGVLMRARLWVMAFHQGEFGAWNWWLMLCTAIALTILSLSALFSYALRKRNGTWGVPKVPVAFKIGYGIITVLVILSLVFPLFGISVLAILCIEFILKLNKKRRITFRTS